MGVLDPFCICSDGSALWAIALGYPMNPPSDIFIETYILLKSNDNPINMDSLAWSIVSTIQKDSLYLINDAPNGDCSVDNKGVFIHVSDMVQNMTLPMHPTSFPGGIMYDPALPTNKLATGTGGWKNIGCDYAWKTGWLFPLKTPTGTMEIIHIYDPPNKIDSTSLSFGKYNPTTSKFELGPYWEKDKVTNDYVYRISSIAYSANTLYLLELLQGPQIIAIPFKNGTLPLAYPLRSAVEIHPATTMKSCIESLSSYSGVVAGNYYLVCDNKTTIRGQPTTVPLISTFNVNIPTSELTFQAQASSTFPSRSIMVSIGDKSPWGYVQEFRGDIYGLPLSGPEIGKWMRPSFKFNITEDWESWSRHLARPPAAAKDDTSSSSAGGLIGGIVAALVVVGAAVFYFCYRGSVRKAQKLHQSSKLKNAHGKQNNFSRPQAQVVIPGQQPTHLQQQKLPYEQENAFGGQPYPGIIPVEQPPSQQPHPQFQQYQVQLSSHPQPNFATTAGGNGAADPASSAQLGAALPTWEPQPFVPPAPALNASMSQLPASSPLVTNASYGQSLGSTTEGSTVDTPPIPQHSRPGPAMLSVHGPQERTS